MKAYAKIALLVALVLLLTLTACTRSATTQTAVVFPTSTGEAPFPFTTPNAGGVADFGTQTAIARTPQVLIATTTPAPGEVAAVSPTESAGGGAAEGTESGGGVVDPLQPAPEQAAQPVAAANLTPIERPATYTIQKGEHPFCIARRYNLDVASLLAVNGMNRNSMVSIGTTLSLSGTGEWSVDNYGSRALQAHPTSYTVSSGDTVTSIACKFGDVYPEHILQANGLSSPADVQAGMTLQIP